MEAHDHTQVDELEDLELVEDDTDVRGGDATPSSSQSTKSSVLKSNADTCSTITSNMR
jgi:hypothetical protein